MTMHTEFIREHDGSVHNPTGSVPWWTSSRPQSIFSQPSDQSKSLSVEQEGGHQPNASILDKPGSEQGDDTAQFKIFTGDGDGDGKKPQMRHIPHESKSLEHQPHFELGFGQTKNSYVDQLFGVFSSCEPHIAGRLMLPLNLTTDDGPIYVNAKQYHGIIRRRQCRAKAEMENKALRARKPYMHESRHLHALRRPRGCGGRFLNTKKLNIGISKTEGKNSRDGQLSMTIGSQNSEILHSENGNLNMFKGAKANKSNLSGSEIGSMYSRKDVSCFSINYLGPSVRSLSDMISSGHGIVLPGNWVEAADHCSDLNA